MGASEAASILERLSPATLDILPAAAFLATVPLAEVVHRNARALELCGGAGVRLRMHELLHGVARDGSRLPAGSDPIASALHAGSRIQDVAAILSGAGEPVSVSVSIEPIRDAEDRVVGTLTICHSLGRWIDAAAALRRSEQRLALALKAGRLGNWEFDLRTRVLTASAQCKANHGFGPDDDLQLETHVIPAIDAEHRERFRSILTDTIERSGSFEIEVPHRWPDGTPHWLLIAGGVIDPTCMVGVSQDITERRQIEESLRDSHRRYREIVETANEGIWTLDEHATITFVNERMANLVGRTPEEMLGRRKWDFMFRDDVDAMKALFERRRLGFAEAVVDLRFQHRDGHEVWLLMTARPMQDASGRFIGALDMFTDITDRRRAEEALREADRRKDEFLAILGHELRGPLGAILMAVRLLQLKGPPEPSLMKLRDTILRQAVQVSKLVDDLLDVGRIMNGKLRLDKTRVELNTIVRQAIETCAPLIERRHHRLKVSLPDAPVYLHADAARIVQVVSNLLNNAAKYMQEGGQIEVTAHEQAGTAVLQVRDEGVGIAPDMIDRIFQRFVQVGSSHYRSEGGLGLGLSLVKALVDLHGGTIDVRSDGIGKGSEFTVRLPSMAATVSPS